MSIQQNAIETGLLVCEYAPMFHVGDVVRKRRQKAGWSLGELAKRAHVNKGTLSALERGNANYRRETIERVAAALGTSPYELAKESAPDRITSLLVELATADRTLIERTIAELRLPPEGEQILRNDLSFLYSGIGKGTVGSSAWKPEPTDISQEEAELLERWRGLTPRARETLRSLITDLTPKKTAAKKRGAA